MKYKKLKLCALLVSGFGLTSVHAQTMYVKESGGNQTAFTLSNVRKMTFGNGNVTVQKKDNTTGVFALSGIQKLYFDYLLTSVEEQNTQASVTNLITYPNPVSDVINIDLTEEKNNGTISILNLEGNVLQTQKAAGGSIVAINLEQLPQGIYLCRYESATTIKSVKIIK